MHGDGVGRVDDLDALAGATEGCQLGREARLVPNQKDGRTFFAHGRNDTLDLHAWCTVRTHGVDGDARHGRLSLHFPGGLDAASHHDVWSSSVFSITRRSL